MPAAEQEDGATDALAPSPATEQRVRALRIATLAMLAIGVPLAAHAAALGALPGAVAIGVAMAIGAANLAWLRRDPARRVTRAGRTGVALLYALFVFSACTTGGFADPSFVWLFTVPVAAVALCGLRCGWFWAGITVATTIGFWWLDLRGVALPDFVLPEVQAGHELVTRVAVVVAFTLLTSSLLHAQRGVERDLVTANRELRREAMCVQLLEHGAAAANESNTFAAALTSCAERITKTTGWRIAHAWLPAPDDSHDFVSGSIWLSGEPHRHAPLQELTHSLRIAAGDASTLVGRVVARARPEWMGDAGLAAEASARAQCARELGLRCAIGLPVCSNGEVIAVLEFFGTDDASLDDRLLAVLGDVGLQVGRVADRVRLHDRVRHSQKLESVGQLAAGIAHEINNPMAYVRSNLGLLRQEWRELLEDAREKSWPEEGCRRLADCEELIDDALDGVDRTVAIVRDVREFSQGGSGRFELADPNDLVEGALRVATAQQPDGIRVVRRYGSVAPLECLPGQLRQVFLNLILNAFQAMAKRGRLVITTRLVGTRALFVFEDDGPGIAAANRERLFDPFFTTKPAGEGTGLGLFISYEIVRAHGGEIRVQSESGHGARFEVELPVRQAADARASAHSDG